MFAPEVGRLRFIDVESPAWVIVGYPAYVPEILDLITLDDVVYDLAIRAFAYRTDLYGESGTFDHPQHIDRSDPEALLHWQRGRLTWNPDYKPWFYRDIWPILFRADEMTHLTNVLEQSNYPHNQTPRGNFDPEKLSVPPFVNDSALEKTQSEAIGKHQAGLLFLEELEPTLALLDERLKTASCPVEKGFVYCLHSQDVRPVLEEAVAQFAATVYPEGERANDPAVYLRHWKARYAQSQSAPPDDAFKKTYEAAYASLQATLDRIITTLCEVVAQEPGLHEHVVTLRLPRRVPADTASDKDTSLSIEDTFERALQDLRTGKLLEDRFEKAREACTYDFYRLYRRYLFELLRQPGEENIFRLGGRPNNRMYNLPLMPLLCGDNPLTNQVPSKFLRLTDYQHYILRQWAEGKFYNEVRQGWLKHPDTFNPYADWVNNTGRDLDRGVLMNLLGGAFCPGGEVGWLIRNPAIYQGPYRLKADREFANFRQTAAQANARSGQVSAGDYVSSIETSLSQDTDLAKGLQPGDLTKHMALPWQSDFNECSTESINITYEQWNLLNPESEHDGWMKREEQLWETLWWPAHRPLQTWEFIGFSPDGKPQFQYLNWARGVPQTNAGDLKMVTEWARLGFVIRNPYLSVEDLDKPSPDQKYISVERTPEE